MAEKIVKKVIIEVDDKGSLKKTGKDSQTLNRNMKGLSQQSSNASKNFSKQAQGMQGILVPAYAEVAARVFALSAAFMALSKAADYNILIQGQQAYAAMTGKNMAAIAKSVQVASKHMLDFKEASTSVALATTSGISSKQIVAMTKAAVDSSSALGRSVSDTMDRLTRGIVKAEPEILDEIGVIIRLDKVYKDYAESVQKSTQELTEAEKASARYTAIMGQLENKFGGISDSLDPNYFAALSSTVMDIINTVSALTVKWLGGPLRFLTESKTLLVALMALVLKNILGKVFPAITTLGQKLTDMPAKMAAKNKLLAESIKKLKNDIKGSALEVEKFNKMTEGSRMTPGMQQARSKGDLDKYTRLQKAALKRAQQSIEPGGTVKGGIYKGLNAGALKLIEQQTKSLEKVQTNWHTKQRIEMKKHGISLKGLQLRYQQVKQKAAQFGAKQIELMNMSVRDGIKQVGINWAWTGNMGHKALVVMQRGVGYLTVGVKALGVAINFAFKAFMMITIAWSSIKAIMSLWHDFDKPFKAAAENAANMRVELHKTLEALDKKPEFINFEGIAGSFNHALKNSSFAANLADEIYNSTHKAMLKISEEMAQMGWLDKLIDKIKSLLNMQTFKDNLSDSLVYQVQMAQKSGTKLPQELQALVDTNYTGGTKENPATWESYIRQDLNQNQIITFLTMLDKQNELTAEALKSHDNNLKELGQTYTKVAKYTREYAESLVSKTDYDDLAKAHQSLINIFAKDDLTASEKVLGAIEGGFMTAPEELAKNFKELEKFEKLLGEYQSGEKQDRTGTTVSGIQQSIKALNLAITTASADMWGTGLTAEKVLGDDFIGKHQEALAAITARLGLEKESKALQIFGGTAIQEQAAVKKEMLDLEIAVMRSKIEVGNLDKEELANTKEKLRLKLLEVKELGATALAQAQHKAKVEGRSLTITERFLAMSKDLKDTYTSKELEENGFIKILERMEGEAVQTFFAKYIESIDKTIKLAREMEDFDKNFSKLSAAEQIKVVNAQIKALRFTSYSGNMSAAQMARVLKDSDGMGIATSHRKAMKERSFLDEEQYGEGAYTFRKHKVLIDIAMKVEQIKAKNIKAEEKNLQTKWYIEQELWKAQEAERSAIWKERAATFGAAMTKVADSFGSAIGNYFNDIFMNKKPEKGAFRNTLAKGFASAGSGLIANTVQKQVFGNQGFLAGIAGQFMSPEWVDTLFPKTELEMASERTNYLKQIWEKYDKDSNIYSGHPLFGSGNNTYGVKGDYGLGGKIANGAGGEVLSQILPMSLVEMAAPFLGLFQGGTGTSTIFGRGQNMLNTKGYSPFNSNATGSSNFVSFIIQELFGGFFANGGTLGAGKFGIAGENGPELIHGPANITPMKVGGNVTVNVAVDANGQSSVADSSGDGARELGHMVSQAVQSELIEQQRPGGLLSAF